MTTANTLLPIPALPIIQSTVMTLSPTFDGKRHDGHINMLSGYVRGEKTAADLATYLQENQIDASENRDFALFIGERRPEQAAACAAYIASTVLIAPNLAAFLEPANKESSSELPTKEPQDKTTFAINQEKLKEVLATDLAIALANTDIFALIARTLPEGLTVEGYREEIGRQFTALAPVYLARVSMHYQQKQHFNLITMQNNQFTFNASTGYLFHYDVQGLRLQLGGINWYGCGQLMGQNYTLQVKYFTEEAVALLAR